jgi:hypothetical protein
LPATCQGKPVKISRAWTYSIAGRKSADIWASPAGVLMSQHRLTYVLEGHGDVSRGVSDRDDQDEQPETERDSQGDGQWRREAAHPADCAGNKGDCDDRQHDDRGW